MFGGVRVRKGALKVGMYAPSVQIIKMEWWGEEYEEGGKEKGSEQWEGDRKSMGKVTRKCTVCPDNRLAEKERRERM